MSISFSGLASVLDTSSWVEALVSIKKQKVTAFETDLSNQKSVKSTLTTMRGKVSDLRSALEKITDAKFGGSFDLFNKNSVTSGNEKVFTASVTSSGRPENYDISVQQLATKTKATSIEAASAYVDESTKLSDLGVTAGELTVYLDPFLDNPYDAMPSNKIDITEDMTIGDFINEINDIAGSTSALLRDGSINIDGCILGANTDTTNLVSILGFNTYLAHNDTTYQCNSSALYKSSLSAL